MLFNVRWLSFNMPDVFSNDLNSTTSVTVDMLSFSVDKYVQLCF